jgi:hypothetical protein
MYNPVKKEICKCNVYTGDEDKIMCNQIYTSETTNIAFGQNRLHIFDTASGKFTGAKCYDFEGIEL